MRTAGRRPREQRPATLAAYFGGAATAALVLTAAPAQAVGVLSISGAGVTGSVSQSPGRFGSSLGATTLTVSDTTLTTNGWAVTATYAPPVSGTALGGANVAVSGSNVVPDPLGGVALANVVTLPTPP